MAQNPSKSLTKIKENADTFKQAVRGIGSKELQNRLGYQRLREYSSFEVFEHGCYHERASNRQITSEKTEQHEQSPTKTSQRQSQFWRLSDVDRLHV